MSFTTREITFTAVFTAVASISGLLLQLIPSALVPFSLLPLIAMLAGGILGSKLGALSMALYMILGLAGIPVLSRPPFGGLSYIFQPTFGFILGFILCAYTSGKILERSQGNNISFPRYLAAMLLGLAILYVTGLAYLYLILHLYLGQNIGFIELLTLGFFPFALFDLAKALIAVNLSRTLVKRIRPASFSKNK